MTAPLPRAALPALLGLGVLTAAQTAMLWPQWRTDPDLSHGMLMPVVFLLLLHASRDGTPRFPPAGLATRWLVAALLALSLFVLAVGGLYAAALGWSSALVAFVLTAALVCLLGAGLVAAATAHLLPLNWASITAIALWLLSAPLPRGTYARLTLGLQLFISENVLRALHLLGIPAVREGNIIDLANATVGVEDACSGVRSLISCVFAALVFSATLVSAPWARALLIALSVPLAIAMNFLRALLLTLLANRGVDIAGTWHDATGFAVLGATAVLLGGLAFLLGRGAPPAPHAPPAALAADRPALFRLLSGGLAAAAALVIFFYVNTRAAPRRDVPVPDLARLLPATAEGWQVFTPNDLQQFSGILQTDLLAQRTYSRQTPDGPLHLTVYLAFWRPGQATVSLVTSHTPDACWPGAGWAAQPDPSPQQRLSIAGRPLAEAEHRFFRYGSLPQHVWFWHLYAGRPISFQDPYSWVNLLEIALRHGFSRDGEQLFVRVSCDRPWQDFSQEPLLREIFTGLRPLGL